MMYPVAQSEDPEDFIAPATPRVRAGSLLLANTDLLEPTFRRSVIYVVEHNDGGTLGVVLNDTAAADTWRLYQASFVATQATATLEINNTVVANTGERRGMFALAQPTLRLCAPIVNVSVAKTNLTGAVTAGGTTSYQITVTNYGPGSADGSVLTDDPGDGLECTQVQCAGTAGGATCPAVGASPGELAIANLLEPGDGVVLPSLPAPSTVTFTLRCDVDATGD